MEDLYERLREKLDRHPMGTPAHPAILNILRELFTPDEARLALSMSFKGLEMEEIAKRANVLTRETSSLLESMADKGLIYCVKTKSRIRYTLMPPMPGFFEFSLVKGEETAQTRRLGRLWEDYFKSALGHSMHNTRIPMSRVISVNKKISYGVNILPYEESLEIVKRANRVALGQCQCRFSARKCDAPLDVCILLEGWAEFLIDRRLAQSVSVEEAIDALQRAEAAGLVHTTTNTKTPVPYICNCCSCCCYMLRGVVELGHRDLASSRFIASVDEKACTGCHTCVEVCKFKGIEVNEEGIAEVIKDYCMGCGLCSSTCPEDAISMVQRRDCSEPYSSGRDLLLDIAKDKNKLDFESP
jgi:Pyruvate/2-oxoacid:ferredoxin oxidoreductase delta subunit